MMDEELQAADLAVLADEAWYLRKVGRLSKADALQRLHDRLAAPLHEPIADDVSGTIEYVTTDEPVIYERIDHRLEIIRDLGSREIVGVRLSAPRAYAEEVVVKALEWLDLAYADDRFWQTHHGYGSYTISIGGEVGYEFVLRPIGQGFPSLEAAKAAAQADFEARIRSALSVLHQSKEPEGMVLVPHEPTEAMLDAGLLAHPVMFAMHTEDGRKLRTSLSTNQIAEMYRAMIAASPSSASGKEGK